MFSYKNGGLGWIPWYWLKVEAFRLTKSKSYYYVDSIFSIVYLSLSISYCNSFVCFWYFCFIYYIIVLSDFLMFFSAFNICSLIWSFLFLINKRLTTLFFFFWFSSCCFKSSMIKSLYFADSLISESSCCMSLICFWNNTYYVSSLKFFFFSLINYWFKVTIASKSFFTSKVDFLGPSLESFRLFNISISFLLIPISDLELVWLF